MSIIDDVSNYEHWLSQHCDVVKHGLRKKHKRMAGDPLMFFRATCFRFAKKIDQFAPVRSAGPKVLSVGDAHLENWGTWRDGEGRLVWGVNDFDEAALLPCDFDIIRLAASLVLATGLPNSVEERIDAVLQGYREGLESPGPVFVDDDVPWMHKLLSRPKAKLNTFRQGLFDDLKKKQPTVPQQALAGLRAQMPAGISGIHYVARQRGGGSLGRPRFVAFGDWHGGFLVRECKAIVPSAWEWAAGIGDRSRLFLTVANGKHRSPDPFLAAYDGFLIRRLAADSTKVDLSSLDAQAYGFDLLSAMGADLASVHAGTGGGVKQLVKHVQGKKKSWLHEAAEKAAAAVAADYEVWRAYYLDHKADE